MDRETKALLIGLGSVAAIAAIVGIAIYEENRDHKITRFVDHTRDQIDDFDFGGRLSDATDYIQNKSQQASYAVQDATDNVWADARRCGQKVRHHL